MSRLSHRLWHPLLSRLPRRAANRLATLGGMLPNSAWRKERARAERAMREALPELDEAARHRALASLPCLHAREIQDVYRLPNLDATNIDELIQLHGVQRFRAARASGRPVILYSAHFSRLILPAIALALRERVAIHSLVADIDDDALDPWERAYLEMKLRRMGRLLGGKVIRRGRDTRALFRVLRDGGPLVIIVDAPAAPGDRPLSIPFLAGQGHFSIGVLKLARRYNALLLPYFAVERVDGLHGEVCTSVEIGDLDDSTALRAIMAPVEAMIRAHPEQWWMWPHLDAIWAPLGVEGD